MIAARDREAMARFFEGHGLVVQQYCSLVAAMERIDEAANAALLNFLARAMTAPADADPDDLLRKALREVAAARMEFRAGNGGSDAVDPICLAVPELLAARRNQELPGSEALLEEHLQGCEICRFTAARLEGAESAFGSMFGGELYRRTRDQWLGLASAEVSAAETKPVPEPARATPQGAPTEPGPQPSIQTRRRSGGLLGAVKRLTQPEQERRRADQGQGPRRP